MPKIYLKLRMRLSILYQKPFFASLRFLRKKVTSFLWRVRFVRNQEVWSYKNAKQCYERYLTKKLEFFELEKILFIVPSLQILYHYLPITKFLAHNSYVFVPVEQNKTVVNSVLAFLISQKLPHTTIRKIIQKRQNFSVTVSNVAPIGYDPYPPFTDYINLLKFLGRTHVRIMYAGGKIKWNMSPWNGVYHYIFCYGPYYRKKIEENFPYSIPFEMGYPRFDSFFEKPLNKIQILQELGLDIKKPTLVYLPTHGKLSTFSSFSPLIHAISQQYNVIVKPHDWLDIKNLWPENSVYVADKNENNIRYFQIADYIAADYGGSVLGAIYANKRLILLDVEDHFLDHDNITLDSPELIVRHLIKPIKKYCSEEIQNLLKNQLHWEAQEHQRSILKKEFFHYSPYSGKLAAQKLSEILRK